MLVGFAVGAVGLMGCKKPTTTTTTQVATAGGPAPGPIIDTSGDPTFQLTHRVEEKIIKTKPADPTRLDKNFFRKINSAVLVDSACGTNMPKTTYGLAKGVEVTFSFSDNTSYTGIVGDTANKMSWSCKDAGGVKTALQPGNDGEIPDCMATSLTRKLTSIKTSNGKSGDLLILLTEK